MNTFKKVFRVVFQKAECWSLFLNNFTIVSGSIMAIGGWVVLLVARLVMGFAKADLSTTSLVFKVLEIIIGIGTYLCACSLVFSLDTKSGVSWIPGTFIVGMVLVSTTQSFLLASSDATYKYTFMWFMWVLHIVYAFLAMVGGAFFITVLERLDGNKFFEFTLGTGVLGLILGGILMIVELAQLPNTQVWWLAYSKYILAIGACLFMLALLYGALEKSTDQSDPTAFVLILLVILFVLNIIALFVLKGNTDVYKLPLLCTNLALCALGAFIVWSWPSDTFVEI